MRKGLRPTYRPIQLPGASSLPYPYSEGAWGEAGLGGGCSLGDELVEKKEDLTGMAYG